MTTLLAWNERIGILGSVGIQMPARGRLAALNIAPGRLRTVVRQAYAGGLRDDKLVAAIRDAFAADSTTTVTPSSLGGELDAPDRNKPDSPVPHLRIVSGGEVLGEDEPHTGGNGDDGRVGTKATDGKRKRSMTTNTLPRTARGTRSGPAHRNGSPVKVKGKSASEASSPTVNGGLSKPAEAGDLLAIGKRKLWELTNSKRIPCIRIDRSVRYDRRDLERWIGEHREGGITY